MPLFPYIAVIQSTSKTAHSKTLPYFKRFPLLLVNVLKVSYFQDFFFCLKHHQIRLLKTTKAPKRKSSFCGTLLIIPETDKENFQP
jgi:hypothetical protein